MRWWYGVLLCCSYVALIAPAFTRAIWYDESYSVVLVDHSYADIWKIGAHDVHPIGYYLMLHTVHLLFGRNFIAYRLFSVMAILVLAIAGYQLLKSLINKRCAYVFVLMLGLTPFIRFMTYQIRMYSWSICMVTLCFLFAMHIIVRCKEHQRAGVGFWIGFAASSLVGAYLHYYAVICVFIINAIVLVVAIQQAVARQNRNIRPLLYWLIQAFAQIILYMPWLQVMFSQTSTVSQGYWIRFEFPKSLIDNIVYPIFSGGSKTTVSMVLVYIALGVLAVIALFLWYKVRLAQRVIGTNKTVTNDNATKSDSASVAETNGTSKRNTTHYNNRMRYTILCSLIVYVGMVALTAVASIIMGQDIVLYRYYVVGLGVVLVAIVCALVPVVERSISVLRAAGQSKIAARSAWVALIACFVIMISDTAIMIHDGIMGNNEKPLQIIRTLAQQEDSVIVSDNPRVMGVWSATYPHENNVFMDGTKGAWWQKGALVAYKNNLKIVHTPDQAAQLARNIIVVRTSKSPETDFTDFDQNSSLHKEQVFDAERLWDGEHWVIAQYTRQ